MINLAAKEALNIWPYQLYKISKYGKIMIANETWSLHHRLSDFKVVIALTQDNEMWQSITSNRTFKYGCLTVGCLTPSDKYFLHIYDENKLIIHALGGTRLKRAANTLAASFRICL